MITWHSPSKYILLSFIIIDDKYLNYFLLLQIDLWKHLETSNLCNLKGKNKIRQKNRADTASAFFISYFSSKEN